MMMTPPTRCHTLSRLYIPAQCTHTLTNTYTHTVLKNYLVCVYIVLSFVCVHIKDNLADVICEFVFSNFFLNFLFCCWTEDIRSTVLVPVTTISSYFTMASCFFWDMVICQISHGFVCFQSHMLLILN